MGQKVHPLGFRLGVVKQSSSRWLAKRKYGEIFHEDLAIRRFIKEKLPFARISKVEIERAADRIRMNLHTASPGIVIGKRGADVEQLRQDLQDMTGKEVFINIQEVRIPELDAQLVAESIARQLEKRIAFRRAMRRAVTTAMDLGAKGIKVSCSGRLTGAEIARNEWYRRGRVPLHTLRADIDYGTAEAHTTYGLIGVKVWIFKGEISLLGAKNVDAQANKVQKAAEGKA